MKEIDFVVWQEGKYFVAQCLNVNISSFGENINEAKLNLKEAVELYFENENIDFPVIENIILGKETINA